MTPGLLLLFALIILFAPEDKPPEQIVSAEDSTR